MNWDKELTIIANKLAIKYQIPVDKVKILIEDFFKKQKRAFKDPTLPTVMIHNIGRFYPNPKKVEKMIRSIKRKLPKVDGGDKEMLEDDLQRFEGILKRIEEEKHTRNDNKF